MKFLLKIRLFHWYIGTFTHWYIIRFSAMGRHTGLPLRELRMKFLLKIGCSIGTSVHQHIGTLIWSITIPLRIKIVAGFSLQQAVN